MSILVVTLAFVAYGILSVGIYWDIKATVPYCLEDEKAEECLPCPDHAKCTATEIECDERYQLQDGECLPVHLEDTEQHSETDDMERIATPKVMYLASVELMATISLVVLLVAECKQSRIDKQV